eukprot:503683-Rhodomonas_salina.2
MAATCCTQCSIHSAVTAFCERGVEGAFCRSMAWSGTTRVPGGCGEAMRTAPSSRSSCRASMSTMGWCMEVWRSVSVWNWAERAASREGACDTAHLRKPTCPE